MGESAEKTRTFTRIALNPLTIMVGGDENVKYDTKGTLEGRRRFKAKLLEAQIAEAREQIVKSIKKKMKKAAQRGEAYERTEEDDMADELQKMNEQGLQNLLDELMQEQTDPQDALVREKKPGEAADAPDVLELIGTDLVTGLNSPALEEYFVEALDELCPPLASTPRLEDKALRVVFSVGIDVMMVDAERSAQLGKFKLQPTDLLTSTQTDDVFEYFMLPYGDQRDAESPYFDEEGNGEMFETDSDDSDLETGDEGSDVDTDFDSDDSDRGDSESDDPDFDSDVERKPTKPVEK